MSFFRKAALSPTERTALEARRYEHAHELLKVGIFVSITGNFHELRGANDIAVKRGGIPLQPLFDPQRTKLGPSNAFALIGRIDGVPVCTMAAVARYVDVGLQDALEDLTVLYDAEELAKGTEAWCEADADGLNEIRGRVLMLGALWRDPSLREIARAQKVGEHMFAMAMLYGYEYHKPNFAAGMMAAADVEWLGYDKERFRQFHHGVRYVDPAWPHTDPDFRCAMVTMSRERMRSTFLGL